MICFPTKFNFCRRISFGIKQRNKIKNKKKQKNKFFTAYVHYFMENGIYKTSS